MIGMVKLTVAWAFKDLRITNDGRLWQVREGEIRRIVWTTRFRIPYARIDRIWVSSRQLAKKYQQRERERIHLDMYLMITEAQNKQYVPFDSEVLNKLVLECFANNYFLRQMHTNDRIQWELIEYQPQIKVEKKIHYQAERVMGFIFNQNRLAI